MNHDINVKKMRLNCFRQSKVPGEFMLQMRVPGGMVDAKYLSYVEHIANTWGDGNFHFGTRQTFDITGIKYENIPAVNAYLEHYIKEEDAELCLGFKPDADVEGGETNAEGYKGIFRQMAATFGFKYVISTLRESFSATHNGWKAMIYNGEEFYESKRYDIDPIIDRVGGGDSFSGGVIHGLLTKPTQGEALEFAVAASALKHTINGDFNLVSAEEVESLAGGNASGRVQR